MKPRFGFVVAIVALVCLLWSGPALADKSYSADRFDVDLTLQPDGSLVVRETIIFRFVGGPFTYVFRDLAYTGLDEIDRLQAGMDGDILSQGTGPGQVEIVAGRPLKVTWHFASTSDSVHEFVLTYRVQGAVRQETDADALIWRAIPEDHDYDIERSTITLRYPGSIPMLGRPGLSGAAADEVSGDDEVQWTVAGIGTDESVVVTTRFAPGSLVQAPPEWQSRQAEQQQRAAKAVPIGLLSGLLTLGGGLVALVAFLFRRRRAGVAGRVEFMRATTPPDQTPPGLAVRLVGSGSSAQATLFDLAGRGLLRIVESGRGLLGGKRYSLERAPSDEELRPHEQGLLRILFEEKGGRQSDSLLLSRLAGRLSSRIKWYREPLEREMEDAGWLDPRRKTTRGWLAVGGLILLVLSVAVAIVGLIVAGSAVAGGGGVALALGAVAVGVGVALFLLGLIAVLAGISFSLLTDQGEQAAASWRSFGAYLKDIVRGREFVAGETLFERYLPFAAGFGLGERWARYVQKQGYNAIPAWFRALDVDTGNFGAIVAVMEATDASFTSSSGGAGGGGGASGGGASGAG